MKIVKTSLPFLFSVACLVLFNSCEEATGKIEKQLNNLTIKANQLDSVINTELDKVEKLDSVINLEDLKIKKLDSLVKKTSSRLDSIWKKHQ